MTSSTTGLAVNGSFELEYRQPKIVGEDKLVIEDLGNSEDGKFYKEISVSRNIHSIKLNSKVPFEYGGSPPSWPGGPSYNLSLQSDNSYDVVLDPLWYETELKLSNLNCHDETDSTWLEIERFGNWSNGGDPMLGCFMDSIVSPYGIVYSPYGDLHLKILTKRNGLLDSTEFTYPLVHETTNYVHVDNF
jgi:hypothetical protein